MEKVKVTNIHFLLPDLKAIPIVFEVFTTNNISITLSIVTAIYSINIITEIFALPEIKYMNT